MLEETYTLEQRQKLAQILKVEYQSVTDDGPDKSEVIEKEVITATDRLLEFKLTYSKPEAVSRDQNEKDTITI